MTTQESSGRWRTYHGAILAACAVAIVACSAAAHAQAASSESGGAQAAASVQPVVITLDEAIRRAETSDPAYAASRADRGIAALDHSIAVSGLLPSLVYHNQALYTQPNGLQNQAGQGAAAQPAPRFIANNAVREYASQASINDTVGLTGVAQVRRADAAAAQAAAELEIARRGLVAGVTGLFFSSLAADHKLHVAEQAAQEAADFSSLTDKREQAREAAHADVVKAQLEQQQRDRELEDARVAAEKARLELGVLLFPDPNMPYTLSAPDVTRKLATREEVEQAAAKNNPELKSALAALNVSNADVLAARAAYLPDFGLNVTYGIDAPQIAVNGPDKVRNLGYSASLTVDIPVWDWLATEHKVKQSEIRREAAKVALSAAQRRMIADLDEAYSEAAAALDQLTSLDQSVATAAESLRLTKLRYAGGEGTVLEVVDAQNAYVLAQDAREDGRVRYETARANLQTLTGNL
ncbi:MAG TPA: TolC family protein [Terracidiphilus sp.]|nr:TolC family protein [Terracidiphilus sp.]